MALLVCGCQELNKDFVGGPSIAQRAVKGLMKEYLGEIILNLGMQFMNVL